MIIADTDFLVDIFNSRENAVKKMKEIDPFSITVISAQEAWFGAQQKSFEKRLKIKKFLDTIAVIPYERKNIVAVVEIKSALKKTGSQIGPFDEIIAGICITENATLLTRNLKHFSRIKGLKIITY